MNKPAPLNCTQCVDRLADFVDRELTADEVAQVEAHLDRCVDCSQEFWFEGAMLESLKATLRRVRAPESLMARIRRLIA